MFDRLFKRRTRGLADSQQDAADFAVMVSLQELIGLHLQARPVKGLSKRPATRALAGNHDSRFKGRGMDYLESREYQPGDDIRNMDWRVTARSGKPHIKLFQEERERPVLILTDFSAGMFFASRGRFKSVIAAQAAALLGWSAIRHGDRVGGIIINDGHIELSPRPGKKAVLNLLNQLVEHSQFNAPQTHDPKPAALSEALQRLSWLSRPGSLVFIISDFMHMDAACEKQLQKIRRHSECVLIRISDDLEVNAPLANLYRVSDGKQTRLLNTRDRQQAQNYILQFQQRREFLNQITQRLHLPLLELSSAESPVDKLQAFLSGKALFRNNSASGL